MWFSTFVMKNISRRPLRATLTVIAIAIAIGAVEAFVGIASGFKRSFMILYEQADVDIIVVKAGGQGRLNSRIRESLGTDMEKIPGVKAVFPGYADTISFEEQGLLGVVCQGLVPESTVFDHQVLKEGRHLKKDDKNAVVIGATLARNLDKKVGDTVDIQDEPFKIVGILQSNNVFENGAVTMTLRESQRLFDLKGDGKKEESKVTGFSIVLTKARDKALIDQVRAKIQTLEPDITALPTREHVDSIAEIKLANTMAWLISSVALVIGFFGMMNTMVMSVNERTREIGILRAVGWRVNRVIRMILLESLFLGILGAFWGTIGAIILVGSLTQLSQVNGMIDGHIEPIFIVYGFFIAAGVGLLGGMIPAMRAAQMLPTQALHHE